jgi:hypothetical protein
VALELLMNYLGIQKRARDHKGKMYDLKLHRRVELYEKREPTLGKHLMAIKWLGNSGSHVGSVSREDLLDAFEILEHVLDEILRGRSKKIAQLAKKLNKKHGH